MNMQLLDHIAVMGFTKLLLLRYNRVTASPYTVLDLHNSSKNTFFSFYQTMPLGLYAICRYRRETTAYRTSPLTLVLKSIA